MPLVRVSNGGTNKSYGGVFGNANEIYGMFYNSSADTYSRIYQYGTTLNSELVSINSSGVITLLKDCYVTGSFQDVMMKNVFKGAGSTFSLRTAHANFLSAIEA